MAFTLEQTWAPLPRTNRGSPVVLGCDPKATKLLYGSGNSVVMRNMENMAESEMYTEHSVLVSVAKWSPSGYYICSADIHGKIRIWDTVNKEHLLKAEYQPFVGVVRDLVWSPDSTKLAVVGEGRDIFAAVLQMDTGASVKSDMSGHSKMVNSVDWKPTRPFRLATGGEDCKLAIYEGPPFTFMSSKTDHGKYVQVVRFSPDGSMLASAGFGGRIFLYDGKTGELVREIGSPAHAGGVYGLSWSKDGKQLMSASGDKRVCVWGVEGELVKEHQMGSEIPSQQMSCLWPSADVQVSLSLSGEINLFREGAYTSTKGHQGPITRIVASLDALHVFTAGNDGTIIRWKVADGSMDKIEGKGHGNQVSGICQTSDGLVYTTGIDDTLRCIDGDTLQYRDNVVRLGSQPQHCCSTPDDGVLVACLEKVVILRGGKASGSLATDYAATAVACEGRLVAVGGADNKCRLYELEGDSLALVHTWEHLGAVTGVSFSTCGGLLSVCDAYRKVLVYKTAEPYSNAVTADWCFHNAKINAVAFSPSGDRVASGSLDTSVIIWDIKDPHKRLTIPKAHPQAQVTGLAWLGADRLVTVGHDGAVRVWAV